MRKTAGILLGAWVVLGGAATAVAQATNPQVAAAEDYHRNAKFLTAVKDARDSERSGNQEFAIDAYKSANKIAGGQCAECLSQIYRVQMTLGRYEDAVNTAVAMGSVGSTPLVKAVAEYDRGRALKAKDGEKASPKQLEGQLAAFENAVVLYPQLTAASFEAGVVYARLGRIDAARQKFQLCLGSMKPTDPEWLRLQHFADDPELSTHKMAPPFEVTAMDGTKFNLDAMGGRVVLIDFWATWCGPCNRALPQLKKIAEEFKNDPLVILSVSWDSDEAKWREFIAKNDMTWEQYLDTGHKLGNEFGVTALPHYFSIDSDGVLTAEMLGEDSDVEGKLRKLIAKARAAKVQAAQSQTQTSMTLADEQEKGGK